MREDRWFGIKNVHGIGILDDSEFLQLVCRRPFLVEVIFEAEMASYSLSFDA